MHTTRVKALRQRVRLLRGLITTEPDRERRWRLERDLTETERLLIPPPPLPREDRLARFT